MNNRSRFQREESPQPQESQKRACGRFSLPQPGQVATERKGTAAGAGVPVAEPGSGACKWLARGVDSPRIKTVCG
jgi:hypothetical protein